MNHQLKANISPTEILLNLLSVSIFFGLISGLINSFHVIGINQYFKYKMSRLILLTFRDAINKNILLYLSLVFILSVIWKFSFKKINQTKPFNLEIFVFLNLIFITLLNWSLNSFSSHFSLVNILKMIFNKSLALLKGIIPLKNMLDLLHEKILSIIITLLISFVIIFFLARFFRWWQTKDWNKIYKSIRKRKNFLNKLTLLFLSLVIFLSLFTVIDKKVNSPSGPNVILIVIDTLRADFLNLYGYPKQTTPHIQKLSLDSVIFDNVISPAPWTTPALAGLFTSQYPALLGFQYDPVILDSKFLTWAEMLKENNYRTKGIISHTYISKSFLFNQGFDSYDEDCANGHGYVSSPIITQKALTYIQKNTMHKNFLFLHYFDPHFDYILHPDYDYYPSYNGQVYSSMPIEELRLITSRLNPDDIRFIRSLYNSEISFTDEYIGKIIKGLKDLNLYHNSMIILTADHGEEFCERKYKWIGHTRTLYQEQIHVPLLIKFPQNIHKGKRIKDFVGLLDIFPTIMEYLKLNFPEGYLHNGNSLDYKNKKTINPHPIISETKRHATLASIIFKNWKLIIDPINKTKELFNLEKDPLELSDVSQMNEKLVKTMINTLFQWQTMVKRDKARLHLKEGKLPDLSEEQKKKLKSLGYIQ